MVLDHIILEIIYRFFFSRSNSGNLMEISRQLLSTLTERWNETET